MIACSMIACNMQQAIENWTVGRPGNKATLAYKLVKLGITNIITQENEMTSFYFPYNTPKQCTKLINTKLRSKCSHERDKTKL